MSKIALTPAATGSGVFTISSPATSTDRTLTLPDEAGTVLTSVSSLASANLTGAVASGRMPAGSVLQVVNATYGSSVSTSTSTAVTTGLTANIIPTSASSKILVLVNQAGVGKSNSTYVALNLYRGTSLGVWTNLTQFEGEGGWTGTSTNNSIGSCSVCYLDSPATTSATTYTTYFRSVGNIAYAAVQSSSSVSTITLMEIAT